MKTNPYKSIRRMYAELERIGYNLRRIQNGKHRKRKGRSLPSKHKVWHRALERAIDKFNHILSQPPEELPQSHEHCAN